jgi:hypothetical protein
MGIYLFKDVFMLFLKIILFIVTTFSSFYIDAMDKSFRPISHDSFYSININEAKYAYSHSDEFDNEFEDEIIHAFKGVCIDSNDSGAKRNSSEFTERGSSGLSNQLEFASRRKLKVPGRKKVDNKHDVSLSVAAGMYKYCDKRSRIDMMASDSKSSSCGDLCNVNKKYNDGSCDSGRFSHK